MTLTITPAKLKGAVTPPPSKSQAHRLLIAAALAEGESIIDNVALSQDIQATMACLEELGAKFERVGRRFPDSPGAPDLETIRVTGMGANAMSPYRRMAYPHLDCGESGSTLRFLIPIALAVRGGGIFTGHGRLMERPQKPYFDLFEEKGIFYEQKDGVLTVQGLLSPGKYALPGNVSSQFFTGLLFALPLLGGPSVLLPTTPLESEDYLQMTLDAMGRFGVEFPATLSLPPQYHPQGNQTYSPGEASVEPDWSQAGFWFAAGALENPVEVEGMTLPSLQGDWRYLEMQEQIYAGTASEIDVSQNPDLVPPLAAAAALAPGRQTRLMNAGRLRIKESDRLSSVTSVLNAMGADVEEGPDFLAIQGKERLKGGVTVDSFHDHRIAMMTAIAATRCEAPVTLTGAESVSKSYPNFWEEYARLGGKLQEVTV